MDFNYMKRACVMMTIWNHRFDGSEHLQGRYMQLFLHLCCTYNLECEFILEWTRHLKRNISCLNYSQNNCIVLDKTWLKNFLSISCLFSEYVKTDSVNLCFDTEIRRSDWRWVGWWCGGNRRSWEHIGAWTDLWWLAVVFFYWLGHISV